VLDDMMIVFLKATCTAQWTRATSKRQPIFFYNNIDVFKVTKFPLPENDNNGKIIIERPNCP
jgi:hypothetical protein